VFKMSSKKLDYEIKCLNETLGTNLYWNRYQSGYVLFENGNFSSEINSAMTYQEFLRTIQTIRYCFESKLIKNQVFEKIQDDKQDKVRQQLVSLKN
tara:strand:- start:253 stop:540 length:288 start_codon:yes stop_codon:yes gene_type:complete